MIFRTPPLSRRRFITGARFHTDCVAFEISTAIVRGARVAEWAERIHDLGDVAFAAHEIEERRDA